jgi:hypothetical protein
MVPLAPPRLSTTNGWPSASDIALEIGRAAVSDGPPGGHGTTTVTGFMGQFCAQAVALAIDAIAISNNFPLSTRKFIAVSLCNARWIMGVDSDSTRVRNGSRRAGRAVELTGFTGWGRNNRHGEVFTARPGRGWFAGVGAPFCFFEESTMRMQKHLAIPLCICAFYLPAAWGDGGGINIQLDSYEEVPSVSSPASGNFRAHVDQLAGEIHYELSYENLSGTVTQSHIHFGQRGVNGGITVFLCQGTVMDPSGLAPTCPQAGTVTGTLRAANMVTNAGIVAQGLVPPEFDELLAAIRGGVTYVNVHSTTFPGGEIRGQIGGRGLGFGLRDHH